jgi:alpha-2,8-polysialyltransferase (POLYST)
MRTQIFLASTLYGAATLAAALDADCFPEAERRVLLVSNNAAVPETATPLDRMPGFDRLRGRFESVLSWNETIRPHHPSGWAPRPDDVPLWERYLRLLWDMGTPGGTDEVELVLESLQVSPAHALAQLFPDAPIDVYADGLMSYGPTRSKLDPLIGTRVRRLLHPDLLPGLTPLLLAEFGVPSEIVPSAAVAAVFADLAAHTPQTPDGGGYGEGPAVLLGQYLSALDILSADEEEALHVRMLRGAARLGHHHVVFKPHPVAPARFSRALEKEAGELGVALTVLEHPLLAEVLFARVRPALVVGCFSTALLTASALHGLPVARTGTEVLLERLAPYENSNRVPVTLVDAAVPDLDALDATPPPGPLGTDTARLGALLRAVGFCMQPKLHPRLRAEAAAFLAAHPAERARYVKRRRLTALQLPGGVAYQAAFLRRSPQARRVARRARALGIRMLRR